MSSSVLATIRAAAMQAKAIWKAMKAYSGTVPDRLSTPTPPRNVRDSVPMNGARPPPSTADSAPITVTSGVRRS